MHNEEWHARRRQHIGSSDMPKLCHVSPWGSDLDVYLSKVENVQPSEPNEQQQTGLDLEPLIADWFTRRTGLEIVDTQFFMVDPHRSWQAATIDGITERNGIVEFKAVGSYSGRSLVDGDCDTLPEHWVVQAHHQMDVCRVDHCWLAVFDGASLATKVFDLPRNELLITAQREIGERFWRDHVLARIPPVVSGPGDLEVVKQAFRRRDGRHLVLDDAELELDAALLTSAKAERLKWDKAAQEYEAKLRLAVGDADSAELPGGWRLSRTERSRKAYTVAASTYIEFKVKGPKNESE